MENFQIMEIKKTDDLQKGLLSIKSDSRVKREFLYCFDFCNVVFLTKAFVWELKIFPIDLIGKFIFINAWRTFIAFHIKWAIKFETKLGKEILMTQIGPEML